MLLAFVTTKRTLFGRRIPETDWKSAIYLELGNVDERDVSTETAAVARCQVEAKQKKKKILEVFSSVPFLFSVPRAPRELILD